MRRCAPTLGGPDGICYLHVCGESMYDAAHASRLNIASRGAALLLSLLCLHACSSGEDTRSNDPPAPPPPPPPSGETSGLDARPANATCLAWDRPSSDDTISLTRYTNLTFSSPVAMLQAPAPAGSSRWFVVEKGGVVRTFPVNNPTSST